jgi:hypothetical protein
MPTSTARPSFTQSTTVTHPPITPNQYEVLLLVVPLFFVFSCSFLLFCYPFQLAAKSKRALFLFPFHAFDICFYFTHDTPDVVIYTCTLIHIPRLWPLVSSSSFLFWGGGFFGFGGLQIFFVGVGKGALFLLEFVPRSIFISGTGKRKWALGHLVRWMGKDGFYDIVYDNGV